MPLLPMAFSIHWPRLARRALRILSATAGVIILAWLALVWYVNAHKQEILADLTHILGEQMRGELHVDGIEPSLFHSFPDVSLALNGISLRDSLWQQHHHSLLEARSMYALMNPFALLSHRVEIRKLSIAHGSIYLFTDSAGYSNDYLLEQRDTSKKNHTALVDRFGMEDMHFWFVNMRKQKLFHLYFRQLEGASSQGGGVIHTRLAGAAHVYSLAFSTVRGSYLKDQDIAMDMALDYRISDKHLHIPEGKLRVRGLPITLGGDFYFNRTPAAFAIHLVGNDLPYKTALSWASQNIQRVLQPFAFLKPISMDMHVSGEMKYRTIPLIRATYSIVDNTLTTPLGNIEHLSYSGEYFNEATPGAGHGDDNSRIGLYAYKGSWRGIPFHGDTLAVTNLLRPAVKAHLQSAFPVATLNDIVGGTVMSFQRGNADADLRYTGGILPDDPTPYAMNGYVRVADAGLTYLPRNLTFNSVGATLLFQDDNLFFRNITIRNKQSSVMMEGDALHFLRLYFSDPGKVALTWRVRSPLINLNDYTVFVARRRRVVAPTARGNAVTRIGTQLDRVLEAASFSVDARIQRAVYKSFTADDLVARATLAQSGIILQQVQIRNGGGTLLISGSVNQAAANNPFHIKATVRDADVSKLFASFDNFGQDAIIAANLAGRISADADVSGTVTDEGTMLKNSLNGGVTFRLENGQMNHFAPLEKVGKFIFKKRNLSALTIRSLTGRLDVMGQKIFIRPMSIQTSAIDMNVQGVYGLGGGTDIYMEVPLRNPEGEGVGPIGKLLRRGKGFVLHLRAQDADGKGVRIGWDPLRKGRDAGM